MWSIRITLAELRRSFQAPFCNKPSSSTANRLLNKRLHGCTPPETSYSFFFFPTDILPPLEPRTKIQSCTLGGARITKKLACGPQYYQGLVQTCFHSMGAWHQRGTVPWFSWVGHSTLPSVGLRSQPQELQLMWMFFTQSQLEEPLSSLLIPAESESSWADSQVLPWEASNRYLQLYLAFCRKTEDLKCYEGEKKSMCLYWNLRFFSHIESTNVVAWLSARTVGCSSWKLDFQQRLK